MKLYFYRDCANLLKVVSGARLGDLIKSGAVNKSTNIYLVDSPGGGESINTVLNLGGRSKHPATLIEFLRSEKKAGFMFASKSTIGGRELAGLKNIAGQPKVCIDKLKSYSSVSRAGQCIVTDVEDIRDLKEPKMLFSPLNAEAYLAGCAKTNSLTIKNYAAGGGFTDEFVSSQVPVPKVMLAAEHLLDRNKAKAEETVDAWFKEHQLQVDDMVSTGVVAKINIETMGREDVEATHRAIAEDDLSVVEINTARKKAECWVKSGEGYDLGRSVGSSIGHKRITVEDSQARSKSVGCSGNDAGARADSGPMGGPRIESWVQSDKATIGGGVRSISNFSEIF